MEARNCGNLKELSEDCRAVTEYTPEVIGEHRETGATKVFSLGDIRLYECPLSYITEDSWNIIRLVFLLEDSKHLLFAGEWAEQPAWLIEATEAWKAETARQIKKESDGRK